MIFVNFPFDIEIESSVSTASFDVLLFATLEYHINKSDLDDESLMGIEPGLPLAF